jgi:hypothetical protein
MQRLENKTLFKNFQMYEAKVATEVPLISPTKSLPELHPWLESLAKKNQLSLAANTRYLLHGTNTRNLASISQHGLRVQHAKNGTYGDGIYFTDHTCKARQYGDGFTNMSGQGCILICRVVLGNVQELFQDTPGVTCAGYRYHSHTASMGRTQRRGARHRQLHNEYVIFKDCACYPEFVLTFDLDAD